MEILHLIQILLLSTLSFAIAMAWTPFLTHYLYQYKCWKKKIRTVTVDGRAAEITAKIEETTNVHTPRMGGLLIWVTTFFVTMTVFFLSSITSFPWLQDLNFFTRSQTWIPLFTLIMGSLIGLGDDLFTIYQHGESAEKGAGIRFRHRLFLVSLVGLIGGVWLYSKLGWNSIHIPFDQDIIIGWLFVPLFILVVDFFFLGTNIDGIDGLSGGMFAILLATFSVLAYARGQYDLASFCGVVFGATLAFLWFNIPPARFYMGETGMIGLTTTLAVVAFFTDSVLLLPVIAFMIFLYVVTTFLQLASKYLRHGKKIFLAAPIHHHFQALGWPSYKVTMRFWLISAVTAIFGLIFALVDVYGFY